MTKNRPHIPAEIEREVRRKAYYGCVHCGCPIIEYHHIIPYSEVHEHKEDNLVALCSNCHREVHGGVISARRLQKDVANPYNKSYSYVAHSFSLEDPYTSYIDVAGNKIFNTRVVLRVNDTDIIWFNIDQNNQLLLNAHLYNALGILTAQIVNNQWFAFIDDDTWDITYKSGVLLIKSSKNRTDIRFELKDNVIYFECDMLLQGKRFVAKKDEIRIGEKENTLRECILGNFGCAIWIDHDSIKLGCQ